MANYKSWQKSFYSGMGEIDLYNINCNTEYYLARHCAVSMAGIKPSSLVRYPSGGEKCLRRLICAMGGKGICFKVLQGRNTKLIMVYRRDVLEQHLQLPEHRSFLYEAGYPDTDLDGMLKCLQQHLQAEKFPHEIGIFLGYPIEDVRGFIERPNSCEYCGMWKVYSDTDAKKKLFAKYKSFMDEIALKVMQGQSLAEIF